MVAGSKIVLSGAPGTGKSTAGRLIAAELAIPFVSLDDIKEALADILGTGGEDWSDRLGDAAAEILFRLCHGFPAVVAEGWWRRERRDRAVQEFEGWIEVFCHCDPDLAERRMRARVESGRHLIHRDVINPAVHTEVAELVRSVEPLGVGRALIQVNTTDGFDLDPALARVREALS